MKTTTNLYSNLIKSTLILTPRSQISPHKHQISTLNSSISNLIITNPLLISLQKCTSMSQLHQIQAQMIHRGIFSHIFPVSRIIAFSALDDRGDITYARRVFDQIPFPNAYILNTMIKGCCKTEKYEVGISLFRKMVEDGVGLDERSLVFGLKAYTGVSGLREGRGVHCLGLKVGFDGNVLVRNGLVSFYSDGGFLDFARQVFDESCERDVVTWTAMIGGYVRKSNCGAALRVFELMVCSEVVPNEVTMVTLLSACAIQGDLWLGRVVHGYVEKFGVLRSLNLVNAMVDMYVKCGCLSIARRIFREMEVKDVFSWTSMVDGCAKNGELGLARGYFDEMPAKNVVSWNAMIAGYSQNYQPKDALGLFEDMVNKGVVPNEATLVSVLSACAQSSCLDLGQWIHSHFVNQKKIELSVSLGNAFIDMYGKCGKIDMAEKLFNEMPHKDLVSWNSMIVGYADHGKADDALCLFERMKDMTIKPDAITFIGVLAACGHAGLVAEGHKLFNDMEHVFGLQPKVEHYVCMIDLLGRVGMVEEAYDLIRKMPMEPDEAAWGALLNGCRMHKKADIGKIAADKLIDLDPADSGTYVILANLCSRERRWGDVSVIRSMMREKGVKKTPGRSSIEVEGEFHEFSVADDSHPRSKDIYKMLEHIYAWSHVKENVASMFQSINCFENDDTALLVG